MLVITGTQRSGTSLMAKFFKLMHYDLGTAFWDPRINGGLENPDVCHAYKELVGTQDFPFSKFWSLTDKKDNFTPLKDLNKPVIKFSYLTMLPEFIDYWFQQRGNQDHFLIMKRPFIKVAKSKKYNQIVFSEDWEGLDMSAVQMKLNHEKALKLLRFYGISYSIIPFPIISDFIPGLREFSGLDMPDAERIWENLYNIRHINIK